MMVGEALTELYLSMPHFVTLSRPYSDVRQLKLELVFLGRFLSDLVQTLYVCEIHFSPLFYHFFLLDIIII